MSNKNKRWTDKERQIVADEVSNGASNIREACKKAAEKLDGRTPEACQWQYHNNIRPSAHLFNLKTYDKSFESNVKNTPKRAHSLFTELFSELSLETKANIMRNHVTKDDLFNVVINM